MKMNSQIIKKIGKSLGVFASISSVLGFLFVVYEKTQIDPRREQLNRLTALIELQKEQNGHLKTLINEANLEKVAFLPKDASKKNSEKEETKSPEEVSTTDVDRTCNVNNPTHTLIVGRLNVREGPAVLGSMANKQSTISNGSTFRVLSSKNAGVFWFGTDWYKIEYCDDENEIQVGWISSKLENGMPTTENL